MTDYTIEADFRIRADQLASNDMPRMMTHHFKNFSVTPEGHIIIKNFSVEFREKLQSVLMDESIPHKSILPVMTF
jgi:hypothetical protein